MIIESNKKEIPVDDLLRLNDYDPFNKTWDVKNWLAIGKDKFPKTKKPENVSGKRDLEPRS